MKDDVHQAIRQTLNIEYLSCKCHKIRWRTANIKQNYGNGIKLRHSLRSNFIFGIHQKSMLNEVNIQSQIG